MEMDETRNVELLERYFSPEGVPPVETAQHRRTDRRGRAADIHCQSDNLKSISVPEDVIWIV